MYTASVSSVRIHMDFLQRLGDSRTRLQPDIAGG